MAWRRYPGIPPYQVGLFVYALYRDGQLIYIGRTGNIRSRLCTHQRRIGFHLTKFSQCSSWREARWRERKLLYKLRPCCNKILPSLLYREFYYAPSWAVWKESH